MWKWPESPQRGLSQNALTQALEQMLLQIFWLCKSGLWEASVHASNHLKKRLGLSQQLVEHCGLWFAVFWLLCKSTQCDRLCRGENISICYLDCSSSSRSVSLDNVSILQTQGILTHISFAFLSFKKKPAIQSWEIAQLLTHVIGKQKHVNVQCLLEPLLKKMS